MIFIYMFFLHFIADFILQPREMGRKKSSDFNYLAKHIAIIFGVFLVGLWPVFGFVGAFVFSILNAMLHMFIDAFIWKGYAWSVWKRRRHTGVTKEQLKVEWRYWDDHWFYVTIGLDQFLHMASLILVLMVLL